ncbi:MAG: VOC family protein [Aestuariibacter sp.]
MNDSENWRVRSVMPILGVPDLEAASQYYEKLGFKEQWRYPDAKQATHLGMSFSELSFMFSHCEDSLRDRQNLYITMENLSSYYEHLSTVLPDIGAIVETDYGMKDISITDPWGHILTFGEPENE